MNLRALFTVTAIVALFYALILILVPATSNALYGLGTSASEILLARLFGISLLNLGLLTWLARDFTGFDARPLVVGGLIAHAVGFVVVLLATLSGVMGPLGWSAVVIYLVLALGFAYFQFMAPAK
jgi:hypothetical protein